MTLPNDTDLAALLADAPERMFIDGDGDLCREGGGDNLVACVAHDDAAPFPALNPVYLRLAAHAPDLARAVLDLRAEVARLTAERDAAHRAGMLEAAAPIEKRVAEKRCPECNGRGYHRCPCWPADCICGQDDEDCWRCEGTGFLDLSYGKTVRAVEG